MTEEILQPVLDPLAALEALLNGSEVEISLDGEYYVSIDPEKVVVGYFLHPDATFREVIRSESSKEVETLVDEYAITVSAIETIEAQITEEDASASNEDLIKELAILQEKRLRLMEDIKSYVN